MKRWSLGILLVMAVVWIWAAKKDDRTGAEPEEMIPVEHLVLPEEKKTEKKRIALTFDDGPHPIYTPQMLELLKEEQVPATFFLLGENVELYGDVVKKIAKEGHLIGNHTYHHVQVTSLSLEEACKEIQETSDLIEELTEYVRPPFGTWNEELEERLNMIPVMWSIDTKDWTTQNVDWIVRETVKHAEDHDIILMHDSYQSTVDAVKRVIEQLEAEGFEFVTVDEIIMD